MGIILMGLLSAGQGYSPLPTFNQSVGQLFPAPTLTAWLAFERATAALVISNTELKYY